MKIRESAEPYHSLELSDNFYRDRFGQLLGLMIAMIGAMVLLVFISVYFYLHKPKPILFPVHHKWRVMVDMPLDQPYLSTPDLLQWVNDAMLKAFSFDFYHYNEQLQVASRFFTEAGWKVFLDQLNTYANYNNVQAYKMFVIPRPNGAPFVLQRGRLEGKYGWWIKVPLRIDSTGNNGSSAQEIILRLLVVRVPLTNNLMGVGIENVIVEEGSTAIT